MSTLPEFGMWCWRYRCLNQPVLMLPAEIPVLVSLTLKLPVLYDPALASICGEPPWH